MLSRVAERVYWMARYIERAENTARMIHAYTHLVLDLPVGSEPGWDVLVRIAGYETEYARHYRRMTETNVIKHLLADSHNPGSLRSSVALARENVRTTREVIPAQAWHRVNELHLLVAERAARASARRNRFAFLHEIMDRCQQLTGLLVGSMNHDHAYRFVRIGRNLERADMTSRILDVGAETLLPREDSPLPYDALLWVNILKAMSAQEAYRNRMGARISARGVLGFLLIDTAFPRSIGHCLGEIESCVSQLPRNLSTLAAVHKTQKTLGATDTGALAAGGLHQAVDHLQLELMDIHQQISQSYFARSRRAAAPA